MHRNNSRLRRLEQRNGNSSLTADALAAWERNLIPDERAALGKIADRELAEWRRQMMARFDATADVAREGKHHAQQV